MLASCTRREHSEKSASFLIASLLLLFACDSTPRSETSRAKSPTTSASTAPAPSGRRTFIARRDGRCVLYWTEGEQVGPESTTPCPRELIDGERLEFIGKTCMRFSTDPSRRLPTRCPGAFLELTEATSAASGPE